METFPNEVWMMIVDLMDSTTFGRFSSVTKEDWLNLRDPSFVKRAKERFSRSSYYNEERRQSHFSLLPNGLLHGVSREYRDDRLYNVCLYEDGMLKTKEGFREGFTFKKYYDVIENEVITNKYFYERGEMVRHHRETNRGIEVKNYCMGELFEWGRVVGCTKVGIWCDKFGDVVEKYSKDCTEVFQYYESYNRLSSYTKKSGGEILQMDFDYGRGAVKTLVCGDSWMEESVKIDDRVVSRGYVGRKGLKGLAWVGNSVARFHRGEMVSRVIADNSFKRVVCGSIKRYYYRGRKLRLFSS